MPRGRRRGSRNVGYYFRTGRGWFTKTDKGDVPLRFENGQPMRLKDASKAQLNAALDRALNGQADEDGPTATVMTVCQAYLDKVKAEGSPKTYADRADTLYDFCTGFPPRFRESEDKPTKDDRIHKGYGGKQCYEIIGADIDRWLAKHPTWKGGRRTRVQAVKRAFNYGHDAGLITDNPILGYKVAKQNARRTYITPEQESALLADANDAIGMAIQVCIRTGSRPGCEFAKLTAAHVTDQGEKMVWTFQEDESKTKKLRIIRVTAPEILEIVRQQIAAHPSGAIFRNTRGEAWTHKSLSIAFRYVRKRVAKQGVQFDKFICMYSCRHTFAKRVLNGFWTGKQTNLETLANLMGNSPEVCRKHYIQWVESYDEPLWASV
jgi:integrase